MPYHLDQVTSAWASARATRTPLSGQWGLLVACSKASPGQQRRETLLSSLCGRERPVGAHWPSRVAVLPKSPWAERKPPCICTVCSEEQTTLAQGLLGPPSAAACWQNRQREGRDARSPESLGWGVLGPGHPAGTRIPERGPGAGLVRGLGRSWTVPGCDEARRGRSAPPGPRGRLLGRDYAYLGEEALEDLTVRAGDRLSPGEGGTCRTVPRNGRRKKPECREFWVVSGCCETAHCVSSLSSRSTPEGCLSISVPRHPLWPGPWAVGGGGRGPGAHLEEDVSGRLGLSTHKARSYLCSGLWGTLRRGP